jgi:hypothetical protein
VTDELRTWDLRIWTLVEVGLDSRDPLLAAFLDDVRALIADRYADRLSARWIVERRDRHDRPRVRIHPPPRPDAGSDPAERSTP